ncbi:MAG TPA: MFS transporter, partial [Fimbriimonas sp.]
DPVWRRRAVVAMVIGTVGVAGAQTATFWLPNLVTAASQGRDDIPQRISYATLLAHVGTLAGVIAVPWLCDRLGRKRTIFAFYLLTPFVVAAAISGGAEYSRILLTYPIVFFFAVGVSAAFVLYFPELFPTRMRATGAGIAYNVGRILSIPMPAITGWIAKEYSGSIVAGVLFSGAVYILGLLAIPFAPETKGQPLAE